MPDRSVEARISAAGAVIREQDAIAATLALSELTIDSHVVDLRQARPRSEAGTNRRVQAAAACTHADLETRGRVG